jgi:hypothetical protein
LFNPIRSGGKIIIEKDGGLRATSQLQKLQSPMAQQFAFPIAASVGWLPALYPWWQERQLPEPVLRGVDFWSAYGRNKLLFVP